MDDDEYYEGEPTSCSCHLGNPPCTYCTDYCHNCASYIEAVEDGEEDGCAECSPFEVIEEMKPGWNLLDKRQSNE